jgi:PKD repeat protein
MKHPFILFFVFFCCLNTVFAYPFTAKGRVTTGKDFQPCAACAVYMISDDNKYADKMLTDKDGSFQLTVQIPDDIASVGMKIATYDPCTKAETAQTTKAAKTLVAEVKLQVCTGVIAPPPVTATCYEPYFKYSPDDNNNPSLKWTFYGPNQDKTTLKWNFGDGSPIVTDITPSHTFPKEGSYKVTLTTKMDTCEKSHTEILAIVKRTICAAKFEYNFDSKNPLSANFIDRSLNATKWDWYFGTEGRSAEQNPKFTFSKEGYHFVTQVIYGENGCADKYGIEILVGKVPSPDTLNACIAKFDFKQDATNPLIIQFQNLSYKSTIYTWDFGDGTPQSNEKNPKHTYTKSGEYKVTLLSKSVNGCMNVLSLPVFAGVRSVDCYAKIYYTAEPTLPLTLNFQGFANEGKTWLWDFGDGKTANTQNIAHTYAKEGVYKLNLTVTNDACKASTSIEIQVINTPAPPVATDKNCQALFAFSQDAKNPQTIIFKDMSSASKGKVTNWGWIFGDATSAIFPEQHPTHTFVPGTYEVRLKIVTSEGCTSEYRMKVTVGGAISYPKECQALFIPNNKGLTVSFQNKSFSTSPTKDAYRATWDFGDGTTSQAYQPTHDYKTDGQYKVTLTFAHGGCTSSITVLLDVNRTKLTNDDNSSNAFEIVTAKTVTATNEPSLKISALKIAPMPVQDAIQLSFTAEKAENGTLRVYDVAGKWLKTQAIFTNIGENNITVAVRGLQHGLYLMQLQTVSGQVAVRFVK